MQITVSDETAREVLAAAEITECAQTDRHGRPFVSFTLPGMTPRSEGGKAGTDYLWDRQEAVQLGLEVIATAMAHQYD